MDRTGKFRENEKRLKKSLKELEKAKRNRQESFWTRKWIESNEGIHSLNFWYRRHFTKGFQGFLMDELEVQRVNIPSEGKLYELRDAPLEGGGTKSVLRRCRDGDE